MPENGQGGYFPCVTMNTTVISMLQTSYISLTMSYIIVSQDCYTILHNFTYGMNKSGVYCTKEYRNKGKNSYGMMDLITEKQNTIQHEPIPVTLTLKSPRGKFPFNIL